jgi:Sortase domain
VSPDTGQTAGRVLIGLALVALAVTGNAGVAARLGTNVVPASSPAPGPLAAAVSVPLTAGRLSGRLLPPNRMRIPKIGVSAPVSALEPAPEGAVPSPNDPGVVGWYTRGPVPGEMGPAVFVGHLDSYVGPAVFWRLGELRQGDEVIVGRPDGSSVRFQVARAARYPRASFPSGEVYGPTAAAELRLITCAGSFNPLSRQYSDNVVVYATMVA